MNAGTYKHTCEMNNEGDFHHQPRPGQMLFSSSCDNIMHTFGAQVTLTLYMSNLDKQIQLNELHSKSAYFTAWVKK